MDKITVLPEEIDIDGSKYVLDIHQVSGSNKEIPHWWVVEYLPQRGKGIPPFVHSDKEYYYLCCCAEIKEEAYNDMLERVSNMKPMKNIMMEMLSKFMLY